MSAMYRTDSNPSQLISSTSAFLTLEKHKRNQTQKTHNPEAQNQAICASREFEVDVVEKMGIRQSKGKPTHLLTSTFPQLQSIEDFRIKPYERAASGSSNPR